MSAESNIKVGDRVRLRPGLHPMKRSWAAMKGLVALSDGAEITLVRPNDRGRSWYFTHPDLGGADRVVDCESLERLPDPAQAESDLMTRLEEGVQPPRSKPRPEPTIEGTVAGAAAWAQQDPDLRRVTVAVHKGVVDIHANLSPFSAARRLRLCIPFCADAVSCFLDGMMMEPDRGLCVTVNRSAEVA